MARLRQLHTRPGVRVEPAGDPSGRNEWTADDMRRLLKHPKAGAFRSEGSIEWPDDGFTRKRLLEGSVKIAEEKQDEPKSGSKHHRGDV
jgi:hypothetical protein